MSRRFLIHVPTVLFGAPTSRPAAAHDQPASTTPTPAAAPSGAPLTRLPRPHRSDGRSHDRHARSGPSQEGCDSAGASGAIFSRAIEHGNVLVAEATAREIGLSLEEALQLVLLYAAYEPQKLERAALRWFSRYLDEGKGVSLLKAQLALSALAELRVGEREAAAKMLTELVRRSP